MPDCRFARHLLTLLGSAVLGCSTAIAAEPRWYQVELMVFAHQPGDFSEQFEATPALSYPSASRFLVDPERVAANAEAHPGESHINEFGRQIIEWVDLDPNDPGVEDQALADPGEATAQSPADTDTDTTNTTAQDSDSEAVEEEPEPIAFVLLPDSRKEFRGKAAYMQRSGRYRILFHESWLQPVSSEAAALPIVLDRSGDEEQPWPELQGSIKLHLARYLHLQTNLWLNTQGNYLGGGQWRMPTPPRGPQSLVVEEPPEEETIDVELPPEVTDEALLVDVDLDIHDPNDPGIDADIDPYPHRHAVLLKQKRRMRSEEIHYIDHPLFGVVARLIPVDIEQILAEQQAPEPLAALDAGEPAAAAALATE